VAVIYLFLGTHACLYACINVCIGAGKSRFEPVQFYMADKKEFRGQEAKASFMAVTPHYRCMYVCMHAYVHVRTYVCIYTSRDMNACTYLTSVY
jgi:hypothetical protein